MNYKRESLINAASLGLVSAGIGMLIASYIIQRRINRRNELLKEEAEEKAIPVRIGPEVVDEEVHEDKVYDETLDVETYHKAHDKKVVKRKKAKKAKQKKAKNHAQKWDRHGYYKESGGEMIMEDLAASDISENLLTAEEKGRYEITTYTEYIVLTRYLVDDDNRILRHINGKQILIPPSSVFIDADPDAVLERVLTLKDETDAPEIFAVDLHKQEAIGFGFLSEEDEEFEEKYGEGEAYG